MTKKSNKKLPLKKSEPTINKSDKKNKITDQKTEMPTKH